MKLSQALYQSTALVRTFGKDEDGAITVDWVVLTAAVVGLGIAVLTTVTNGSLALGGKISDTMGTFELGGGDDSAGGDGAGGAMSGMTVGEYRAQYSDRNAARRAIIADTPSGFFYTQRADLETGYPVYENGSHYSIGGQVMSVQDYESSGGRIVTEAGAGIRYRQGYYDN